LTVEELQQSSMALWYIYSPGCVSKTTFEEPHFRAMMKAFAQRGTCAFLTMEGLAKFVRADFNAFLKHIRQVRFFYI